MKKIDTNLHKPVTFINGTKYKLDKAWTFVNGEKQLIWGESGVQIDYISSTGSLGGGNIFSIGETWANVSNNNTVYRLNITNLSNPTLIQNVSWGNIKCYNGIQSSTNDVFEAWNDSSHTGYKINLNNSDGTLSVDSSQAFTIPTYTSLGVTSYRPNGFVGKIGNNFMAWWYTVSTVASTRQYSQHFLVNDVDTYTKTSFAPISAMCQCTDSSILGYAYNTTGTPAYMLHSITTANCSALSVNLGSELNSYYCDGSYVYISHGDSSTGMTIDKRAGNDIPNALETYTGSANTKLKIVGEINDLLYVLSVPASNISASSEVKLILLNTSDLSFAFEKVLPNDPFNENNGVPTFWVDCKSMPQVSKTGFLGVSTYNQSTLGLRIARFSGLI